MSKYVKDNEWGTKYPNFQKGELVCRCCGSSGNGIATTLMDVLQSLRNKYGALNITSGYRCHSCNTKVNGAANSKHLVGQAADFYFASGILSDQNTRIKVVNEIKNMPYVNYVYCNVNGNYPNMGSCIHVDTKLVDTVAEESKLRIKELQTVLNKQYGCGLAVDGSFGPLTSNACADNYLFFNKKASNHVKWLQNRLKQLNYNVGSSGVDGSFGYDTLAAVKKFQKDRGLVVDGYVGAETHKQLVC